MGFMISKLNRNSGKKNSQEKFAVMDKLVTHEYQQAVSFQSDQGYDDPNSGDNGGFNASD